MIVKNAIFHTTYGINYKHVLNMLQNNPGYIIGSNQVTYIPFYIKYVDNENRSLAGTIYTPIWNDVWKYATQKYALNYSYLPENDDQFVIVRNHQKRHTWSLYETSGSVMSTIRMPKNVVKENEILLFTYVMPADKAILI